MKLDVRAFMGLGKILSNIVSHLHLSRLQSVMNAAARLICSSSNFAPERIAFKCAVLMHECLHVYALAYLINELYQVADADARQRLRSSSFPSLIVSRTRLSTVGDRVFPVAAAPVWNSLPEHVTSAPYVAVSSKNHLFHVSYSTLLRPYSAGAQ